MNNNIGTTSYTLPRIIGNIMNFDDPLELASISVISGELSLGFLLFDNDGTMGVCTKITYDSENNPTYEFRTSTLNAEIDVQNILSQSY